MDLRRQLLRVLAQEDLNFLLTNRLPRHALTRFMGWFSKIEQPLVRDASIAVWRWFSDLDLSEARKSSFTSMHDCFIRELKDGVRPLDMDERVLCSPSDGIVGACGPVRGSEVFQAKGFPYRLDELIGGEAAGGTWRDGSFVTLRLTSGMYHRFHAPADCQVQRVTYFSGDTWNVNPIALKRIERLFCKNERAFIRAQLQGQGPARGQTIALVPVAAILVVSIRLHFIDVLLHMGYCGSKTLECDARLAKGQEMGWFQHGSTIIILAPPGFELAEDVQDGTRIRMGEALLRWRAN